MNLMFWKKKPEAGNNAEDAQGNSSMNKKERESLDVAAATQGSSESNPEAPNLESPEQEAPVKTGLVARIKLKLAALALHFKKTPAPDADEDQGKDTRRRSKDDSEKTEETPEKPGLVERIKSNLGAFISHHKKLLIFTLLLLSLIFIVYVAWDIIFPPLERKRSTDKTPTHESAPHEQPQVEVEALKEKSDKEHTHTEAPKKDSFEQTQAGTEALMKKSEEVQARVEAPKKNGSEQAQAEADALKNKSEDAQALAEALKKESEDTQAQAETLKKQSEAAQAKAEELRKKEIEEKALADAIRKKNEEEKARVEALKKSPRQQQSLDSSTMQAGGSTTPLPNTGKVTVGNKDPKAAAKSLKEAIEAMNAGSGESSKKSAK